MTLHIFNPEHDLALAANLANFTAPHAGRQLRTDLGYLPALWAGTDDCVLVEDVPFAERSFRRLMHHPFDRFVDRTQLVRLRPDAVEPWGWDLALRAYLIRQGIDASLLPSEQHIAQIRDLSHRRHAMNLLRTLQQPGTSGESFLAGSVEAVLSQLAEWRHIVVKAPWSSSGRGVRFIDGELTAQQTGWLVNTIQQQGGVMVEPYYPKVKDFGMEFESDGKGCVRYCGLSLFHTSNGAYTGNIVASESGKMEMLSTYIPEELIENIKQSICHYLGTLYHHSYKGPLGVDMMILPRQDKDGFLLHPCVEINLRRTMGHVALSLSEGDHFVPRVMSILYNENSYKLKLRHL